MVAGEAIYGAARSASAAAERVPRQPGQPADRQPDDRPALGRVPERRHPGRGPVPRRHARRTAARRSARRAASTRSTTSTSRAASTAARTASPAARARPAPCSTNSCFRADPIMNSIVADKRGGAFANDLYVVLVDNRNGTIRNSNNDVFFYKSTDGGVTWIGPTRVNDDPLDDAGEPRLRAQSEQHRRQRARAVRRRARGRPVLPVGDDQPQGELKVTFHDRRLDTYSASAGAWPTTQDRGRATTWSGTGAHLQDHADADGTSTAGGPRARRPRSARRPRRPCNADRRPRGSPVPAGARTARTRARCPFHNFQISDVAVELRLHVPGRDLRGATTAATSTGPIDPAGDRTRATTSPPRVDGRP